MASGVCAVALHCTDKWAGHSQVLTLCFQFLKLEPMWQYVSFFPTPNLLPSSHPLELILRVLSHLLKWRNLTSCQKRWKLCPKITIESGKGTRCSQRSPLPAALLTSRNQGSLSLEFILIWVELPAGASLVTQTVKNCLKCWSTGSNPWIRKIPGGGNGYPLQDSCLENSWTEEPGGYSPWGHKESDMTEGLTFSLSGLPATKEEKKM